METIVVATMEECALARWEDKEEGREEKYTYTIPVFKFYKRSLNFPDYGRTPQLTQSLFIGEVHISEKNHHTTLNGKNLLP